MNKTKKKKKFDQPTLGKIIIRCCVVCTRSTPKTIFSCRYKVHERNVEVLKAHFNRELQFGELCDRCYRIWYKHKRGNITKTKKSEKKIIKRKSSKEFYKAPNLDSDDENFKVIPPKKLKGKYISNLRARVQSTDILNESELMSSIPPTKGGADGEESYFEIFRELTKTDSFEGKINFKLGNRRTYDSFYHGGEKLVSGITKKIKLKSSLLSLKQIKEKYVVHPHGTSFMISLDLFINKPRKSRRKSTPQRSAARYEPSL